MKRPDFFIVGAPKCGTTALYVYLKKHPEIFMPEEKEIHYFGSDLIKSPRITLEEYLSYFRDAKNEKRVGEASVMYLYSKKAASEIKEFCPSANIIIMLRNPVDMIYSLHSQKVYNGTEDITDFKSALDAEEDRKRGLRIPDNPGIIDTLFYRERARYTEHVKRYLNTFGKENVLIIIYDDFKNNTAGVYKETLRFLGVNEDFYPESFDIINPNKKVRSVSLRKILRHPDPIMRFTVKALLPTKRLRRFVRKKLEQLNTVYFQRPPMDQELRCKLQKEFAPEIESLGKLIGKDLTQWCRE